MNYRKVGLITLAAGLALVLFDVGAALTVFDQRQYIETYRGYPIYFFSDVNGCGIYVGMGDPSTEAFNSTDWLFYGDSETHTGLENCRFAIDNLVDSPSFVEAYRSWEIYREPGGYQRYYAVKQGEQSAMWLSLEGLKEWIDEVEGPIEEEPTPIQGGLTVRAFMGWSLMAAGVWLYLGQGRR